MTKDHGLVYVWVRPMRTIRGKRWTIDLIHENNNLLLHSHQRYSRRIDAVTVADNLANAGTANGYRFKRVGAD